MFYVLKEWVGDGWWHERYSSYEEVMAQFKPTNTSIVLKVNGNEDEEVPEEKIEFVAMKMHGFRVLQYYNLGKCFWVNAKILWVPETGKFRSYVDAGSDFRDNHKDFDTLQEAEQNLLSRGFTYEWTDEVYVEEIGISCKQ